MPRRPPKTTAADYDWETAPDTEATPIGQAEQPDLVVDLIEENGQLKRENERLRRQLIKIVKP